MYNVLTYFHFYRVVVSLELKSKFKSRGLKVSDLKSSEEEFGYYLS